MERQTERKSDLSSCDGGGVDVRIPAGLKVDGLGLPRELRVPLEKEEGQRGKRSVRSSVQAQLLGVTRTRA